MKHLIIIGAGGMGRCIYNIAIQSQGYKTDFDVKGFLEFNKDSLNGYSGYPPILTDDDHYEICEDDVFVCSIGDVKKRKLIHEKFASKGANFYTLIHDTAFIGLNTKLGAGTVVDEGVHIDPDVTIGSNCMIQAKAIIGHDCIIGNDVRVDSFCSLVGGTIVKDCAAIYTHAMINHRVTIGEGATVGACSFVIKNVKPDTTVFGVPAKAIF